MKRFLCGVFVVIVALIVTTTWNVSAQVTLSVWNGSAIDTDWYDSDPTATEFTIWTAPQLAGLASLVNFNENFTGKTIHVVNPDYPDVPVVIDLDNKPWKEIGTGYSAHEFQGVFDGHNCVIKNMLTKSPQWKSYIGLFGYIKSTSSGSAIVKNVNVTGRSTSFYGSVGGVSGFAMGIEGYPASIENCTFNGEVAGSSYVGGIVGTLAAYSDVIDCAVSGTVTAFENYAGGIVGASYSNFSRYNNITGCSNAAWVASPEYTGGIIGAIIYNSTYTNYATNIKYCHNGGCVFGNSNTTTGGIIGSRPNNDNLHIQYCINTGTVNMGGAISGCPTPRDNNVNYCYYDKQRCDVAMVGVHGKTDHAGCATGTTYLHLVARSDGTKPDGLDGTESEWTEHFTFKAGYYPIPKNLDTKTAAIIASVPIHLPESPISYYNAPENFDVLDGYSYTSDNPSIVAITVPSATIVSEGTALITVTNTGDGLREEETCSKVFIIEKPYSTPQSPLTIDNLSDLEAFRNAVNAGPNGKYKGVSAYNGFSGITIQITDNIDMTSISSWTPIGTSENPFKGTLDGQCHLISNLTVVRTTYNSGLFGVVNSAKISNIKLTGTISSTQLYVGSFCGRTKGAQSDSTIFRNCHFYGTINTINYRNGGLIGYAGSYTEVDKCSIGGEITTTSHYCAGMIGEVASYSTIENCINYAEIKGLNYVAGIVGDAGDCTTIRNCLNAGNVYGTSENTGGIIARIRGNNSKIINCINTGTINLGGSVVGTKSNSPTFTDNYYDNQRSILGGLGLEGADVSGLTGMTISNLLALTETFSSSWDYYGGTAYPTPKLASCGGSPDAFVSKIAKIAAVPAFFTGGQTYVGITSDFTLGSGMDSWASSNPDIIAISGTNASVSSEVGSVRLIANLASGVAGITFQKRILASHADGSDPLTIGSLEELRAFRDAVNAGIGGSFKGNMNLDGYCGRRFELSGNISLGDIDWEPIGTSDNPFRGDFNGAGHTISGLNVHKTSSYSGLFGYVQSSCGGGIKNLVVEGYVEGTSYVGGICGDARGLNSTIECTIENCHFKGDIKATGTCSGGIAGRIANYVNLRYCTTTGTVTSTSSSVGGIVGKTEGYNESSITSFCYVVRDSVLNCVNNATVTGKGHTGGICGQNYMSVVGYCLNAGQVVKTAAESVTSFGGIVGTNDINRGRVVQCLNVYLFANENAVGNIIGVDNDTVTVYCDGDARFISTNTAKNYYDSLLCANGVKTETKSIGKRTSELVVSTNGTLPSGLSSTFTDTKWWLKAGYYPMPIRSDNDPYGISTTPTLLAASPATLSIGGTGILDTDPDYVNTNQMTTRNFTVKTGDGQTWTPANEEIYSVVGNTVNVLTTNYRRTILTLAIGDYSRPIYFANSLYVPPIAIRYLSDLVNLRNAVNSGNSGSFSACLYDESTSQPKVDPVTSEYVIEEAFNVNGYKGVNFYLTGNITLDDSNWAAIGNSTYVFRGNFHGNNNTIKNLRTNASYGGLFGYIEGSVIDNLNLQGLVYINPTTGAISNADKMVYGSSYLGSLVGCAKDARISSCHVSAVVYSTDSYVGGICGMSVGSKIENCDFTGKVVGNYNYVGGICGYATDNDSIISCTNAAAVSGASYVGGIVGNSDNSSVIKYCNNGGNISSTSEIAGGICGSLNGSSIIDYCLSSGSVNMGGAILGTKDDASSVNHFYYDRQRCTKLYIYGTDDETGRKYTTEMLGNALQTTFETTYWSYETDLYPVPKTLNTQDGAILAAIPLTLDERGNPSNHQIYNEVNRNFNFVSYDNTSWKTKCAEGTTYLTISGSPAVPTVTGTMNDCANIFLQYKSKNYLVKTFFINNPTHEDPIIIESMKNFVKFRDAVNAGENGSYKGIVNEGGFAGKRFKLICDINLADTALTNIKDDFLPIGSLKYPFKGDFNGDGHTISNLQINGSGTNNHLPQSYRALFGYAIGATIDSLNVRCAPAGISGAAYVAGICAYIGGIDGDNYANIRNCTFIGDLTSTSSYVGGICGYALNYTSIDTCEVAGSVNGGASYVGGIVGNIGGTSDHRGYVRSCINVANVGGISYVGGICGQNSTTDVLFCENGGNISGASYITGGIAGSNSGELSYCISTGNVSTGGAIAGSGTNCRYCYYDRTRCSVNGISNDRNISSDSDGAAVGRTPQEITGTAPSGLIGTNWNGTYWNFAEGMFPTPKRHSSNITEVAAMPIFLNDPTVTQVWNGTHYNFTLGSSDNIWTSSFPEYVNVTASRPTAEVDDSEEVIPEGEVGTAILTATIGEAYKKYIVTSALPPDSLSIRNYEELVAFRNAVNNRGEGKYKGVVNTNGYIGITFYIINDIVVSDAEGPWVTIAKEPAVFFGGNIDATDSEGQHHKVTNLNYNGNPSYLGGFIGKVYAGYIKNLTVETKPLAAGTYYEPQANGYFGGICAHISGKSALECGYIENCTFRSDSIVSKKQDYGTGGICGFAGAHSKVIDCINYAKINGYNNTGGVIGAVENTSNTLQNVVNCHNRADMGGGSKNYIGGICGRYYSTGTMSNCTNTGKITGGIYVGGIVGYQYGTSTNNATITNCDNYGDLVLVGTTKRNFKGGITGLSSDFSTITNCTNSGNVIGGQQVGGISGQCSKTPAEKENIIRYCSNSGEITGTKNVGGICGIGKRASISFCINGGNVRGTEATTAGIIGENSDGSITKNNIATGCVERDSKVPNLGSAICGSNRGTLTDNIYDSQRSERKGVANADATGQANGFKTLELTGATPSAVSGATWTDNFAMTSGMYPQPKEVSGKTNAILAATPIFLSESSEVEMYDSVKTNFKVSTENSVAWDVEEPAFISVSGENATIDRQCGEDKKQTMLVSKNANIRADEYINIAKIVNVTLAKLIVPTPMMEDPTPETVCAGQPVNLTVGPTSATEPAYTSYAWGGAGLLENSSSTVAAIPLATTTYTVTVGIGICTATATVSVEPTAGPSISSIADGDYFWTGGASINWDNRYNWVTYDSENSKYVQAANYPNATTHNVFVEQYGSGEGCIHNWTTANQTISVNNVTIGENAAVNVSNEKTLNVSGNVTIGTDATLSADGTVEFAGTAVQTISGDGSLNFNNVTFNNANGINATSLSSPIKIAGNATFTNGIVHGNVYFDKIATYNVDGVNSSKFVDGEVTKKMVGGDEFIFPVGAMVGEGQIAKFKATTANATDLTVRYNTDNQDFDGMPDWWEHGGNMDGSSIHLDHVSDREYWIVGSTDATNLSTVQLYWDGSGSNHSFDTNEDGGPDNFDYLRLAYANEGGFVWTGLTTSFEGTFESGYATATTEVIPFSGTRATDRKIVTFASTKAKELLLPIELVEFSAHCNGNLVEILWTTASERNNDHFVVEKSYDAVNFTAIAQVAGAGNSIERIEYGHTDNDYYGGDVYYRLYQVDYDGTRTYSEIISVSCNDTENDPNVSIFPNPFSSDVTIVLEHFRNEPATIEVYDVMGRAIKYVKVESTYNEYETTLNLEELPAGIYTVRVSTSSATLNRQITKR